MKNWNRNWWLGLLALLCLASTTFAVQDEARRNCDDRHRKNCTAQVPEGGSSLVYVLGAGVTCLGAMFVRSRVAKRKAS
jgi:hypothetical protein